MLFCAVTVYFSAFLFAKYKLFKEYMLPENQLQCFGLDFEEDPNPEIEPNEYYVTIQNYRWFECFLFFAQIICLFFYVLFSLIMLEVKKCLKTINRKDPFIALMLSNEDFLSNHNIILELYNVLTISVMMTVYSAWYLVDFDDDDDVKASKELLTVQLPSVAVFLLYLMVMVWRGTHYKLFYGKINVLVLTILYFVFVAATVLTYFTTYKADAQSEIGIDKQFALYFVKLFCFFNPTVFYFMVLYQSQLKKLCYKKHYNQEQHGEEEVFKRNKVTDILETV